MKVEKKKISALKKLLLFLAALELILFGEQVVFRKNVVFRLIPTIYRHFDFNILSLPTYT